MKKILFVRHASASHTMQTVPDHDRPLSDSGLKEAQIMAKSLLAEQIIPQLYLSSSAKRALDTSKIIINEINNQSINSILVNNKIYYNGLDGVINSIKEADLDNKYNFIGIFGHNPVFEDIYNSIKGTRLHKFPTCAMVLCSFEVKKWIDFSIESSTFIWSNHPNNIKYNFK
tara:strand:- start:39 stop:554 length:516 start_codon:yes stop_codon:yes gene_type:complete